jgi:methylthioribose-1-phosphate isomerase
LKRKEKRLNSKIRPIEWCRDHVKLIDQTKLPYDFDYVDVKTYEEMATAIKDMIVRGAPAIGVSGAFGMVLGAIQYKNLEKSEFLSKMKEISKFINATRPTAVNLKWALDRQNDIVESNKDKSIQEIIEKLTNNAIKILEDDILANKKIGDFGASVVPEGATILTHCNAGALATAGYGTALGVVRSAFEKDNTIRVFADETRPRQQGARLTTWELIEDGIPTTLITDGMSGYFMSKDMVDFVVVGADRIAANGDTANKIGTYNLAIVAKEHNVPFYIAAPLSTIDISIPDGTFIPIEERDREEVTTINGELVCHEDVNVINPGFDVTPAKYIAGIITEKGILRPDFKKSIKEVFCM